MFIQPRIPPGRLKGLAALFKRSHMDSDIAFLGAWNSSFLLVSRTISAQYVSILVLLHPFFHEFSVLAPSWAPGAFGGRF